MFCAQTRLAICLIFNLSLFQLFQQDDVIDCLVSKLCPVCFFIISRSFKERKYESTSRNKITRSVRITVSIRATDF